MEDFRNCLDSCFLTPLPFIGETFTWGHKTPTELNLKETLDYAMSSEPWVVQFPNAILEHLEFYEANHRELHVSLFS